MTLSQNLRESLEPQLKSLGEDAPLGFLLNYKYYEKSAWKIQRLAAERQAGSGEAPVATP